MRIKEILVIEGIVIFVLCSDHVQSFVPTDHWHPEVPQTSPISTIPPTYASGSTGSATSFT
ncbi:MAG: hypothetical protein HYY49_10830 [Ignavibacteriales bacterium]|nr:hypothetical protein [Ignavibacteriales bacterium]